MELRHIYTFQAIVREGSFLRAAEKLQYAQSTITIHMQQLEAELGVKLFARQGKKVQLTEAGRALQEQAEALVQRATALQQTMIDVVTGEAGHIRLGAIEPTASMRLPLLLVPFCQERPKLHLTLEVGGTRMISQRVAMQALDAGICSPPEARSGLAFEPLFDEPLALLIPEQHALANKAAIYPTDLREQRLLLTEQGCGYRAVIEAALMERGTNPFSGIEMGSIEVIKRAVQAGLGIAIIPEAVVNPPPAQTVLRAIQDVDLHLPIGLITLPSESSSGRALSTLLNLLRTQLKGCMEAVEEMHLQRHPGL